MPVPIKAGQRITGIFEQFLPLFAENLKQLLYIFDKLFTGPLGVNRDMVLVGNLTFLDQIARAPRVCFPSAARKDERTYPGRF